MSQRLPWVVGVTSRCFRPLRVSIAAVFRNVVAQRTLNVVSLLLGIFRSRFLGGVALFLLQGFHILREIVNPKFNQVF